MALVSICLLVNCILNLLHIHRYTHAHIRTNCRPFFVYLFDEGRLERLEGGLEGLRKALFKELLAGCLWLGASGASGWVLGYLAGWLKGCVEEKSTLLRFFKCNNDVSCKS